MGRAVPDIKSALRGGGAGGGGGALAGRGRGGITGEPIPLDTPGPDYRDYFEQLRRMIQAKMGWPCAHRSRDRDCEDRNAELFIEFGILKDGKLGFIEIRQSSGMAAYDQYSENAIKLASPFPPLPAALLAAMKPGSAGIPIIGHFTYVYEVSFRSLLR